MKLKGILPGLGLAFGSPTLSPSLCSVDWTTIDGDNRPSCILAVNMMRDDGYLTSRVFPSTAYTERECDALQCCRLSTSTKFQNLEIHSCFKTVSKHNLWN